MKVLAPAVEGIRLAKTTQTKAPPTSPSIYKSHMAFHVRFGGGRFKSLGPAP